MKTTMSIRLPRSLHGRLREVAEHEGISINQLVATAVAEKLSVLDAEAFFAARAARADRSAFDAVLSKVPEGEIIEGDEVGE